MAGKFGQSLEPIGNWVPTSIVWVHHLQIVDFKHLKSATHPTVRTDTARSRAPVLRNTPAASGHLCARETRGGGAILTGDERAPNNVIRSRKFVVVTRRQGRWKVSWGQNTRLSSSVPDSDCFVKLRK
jgi:hypothetical protein